MIKNLMLLLTLTASVSGQLSNVFPIENYSHPGNTVNEFIKNTNDNIGGVIDGLAATTINSISFRPSFKSNNSGSSYTSKNYYMTVKFSNGSLDTFGMTSSNVIDTNTSTTVINNVNITYPATATMWPAIGLQAVLSEPFLITLPLTSSYSHTSGNLQFRIEWGTSNGKVTDIDATHIIDYASQGSFGYTFHGTISNVPQTYNSACYASIAYGTSIFYNNWIGSSFQDNAYLVGSGASVAYFSTSLANPVVNWTQNGGQYCGVTYDFTQAISIGYTNSATASFGNNASLQKQAIKFVNVTNSANGIVATEPSVLTFPVRFAGRTSGGNTYYVPTIRTMLGSQASNSIDWDTMILLLQ